MAAKFDTTSFIGALKNGGARTNLMWCKTAASGISGLDTAFPFLCKASNIPGSTITALEVPYFGRNVKIAGDKDWTLITEGMDFNVPKNSSFCLEVSELVNYTCSYFDD